MPNICWQALSHGLDRISVEELTVAAAREASSSPIAGLTVHRMNTLMMENNRIRHKPMAAATRSHAVWSVSVTIANGGEYPSGMGNSALDMARVRNVQEKGRRLSFLWKGGNQTIMVEAVLLGQGTWPA